MHCLGRLCENQFSKTDAYVPRVIGVERLAVELKGLSLAGMRRMSVAEGRTQDEKSILSTLLLPSALSN